MIHGRPWSAYVNYAYSRLRTLDLFLSRFHRLGPWVLPAKGRSGVSFASTGTSLRARQTKTPVMSEIYNRPVLKDGLRILFILPKWINWSADFVENDFYVHLPDSAISAGHKVSVVASDEIAAGRLKTDVQRLEFERVILEAVEEFVPDVIFLNGDESLQHEFGLRGIVGRVKAAFGVSVVTIHSDVYSGQPERLGYWSTVSDLLLPLGGLGEIQPNAAAGGLDHVFWIPCLPYDESKFMGTNNVDREIDFSFYGTRSRNRGEYLEFLKKRLPDRRVSISLHDRERDVAPRAENYRAILGNSKVTFANGPISPWRGIVVGRAIEAVLSGCCLLYESPSSLRKYLTPWVDYIPVHGVLDLADSAEAVLANDGRRECMAEAAHHHFIQSYHSSKFWNFMNYELMAYK